MVRAHKRRHARLAKFGCVRCGRFLFAPEFYEFDRDVVVCGCDASRYKTTGPRVPRHVQAYWDAQFYAAHSSYRRRLKQHALPVVHAEPVVSSARSWSVIEPADIGEYGANPDNAARVPHFAAEGKLANAQRQAASVLHSWRSALVTGIVRVADVERDNKGKAS